MSRFLPIWMGVMGCLVSRALGADVPFGNLLELHSCEVFAGPCVVSSEAEQGGRYMLRVWDFNGGTFEGQKLRGLQLALLQVSPENLAEPESQPGRAVLYLPADATPRQRQALLGWLASSQPDLHAGTVRTRILSIRFERDKDHYSFRAGDSIAVNTKPLGRCESSACGETLWYQPRSRTSLFTVAVDQGSKIREPWLGLKWDDNSKRNVFVARFGEPGTAKGVFVTMGDVCGGPKAF